MKKLCTAICCFLVFGYVAAADELFRLNWNDKDTNLVRQLQRVGDDGHAHDLALGPQSMGIDGQGQVYLLDNLQQRVLVFDQHGKLLKTVYYRADGCGLAVSADGMLVVYSPFARTAAWINGSQTGKTWAAPDSFSALQEVWFANGWWARCGVEVVSMEGRGAANTARLVVLADNQLALRMAGERDETYSVVSLPGNIKNARVISNFNATDKVCLAVQDEDSWEVFTCDGNGNCSPSVTIRTPQNEIFHPYAIAPDGSLYELQATAKGVIVHRHELAAKPRQLPARREADEQVRSLFSYVTPAGDEGRGVPDSINVYFTNENKVYTVNLQNYLKGVVSAEIYASWHIEAHKAMAVAARTYAVARTRHPSTSPAAMVCTSTHCQAWTSSHNSNAIQGVDATNQVVIYHNGTRITEPLYFAHCNGHTRNSEDYNGWNYIAYLRSKACPCGYTSYYGHGVGACQWGLQTKATQGSSYTQILQHFYTNVTVGK